MKLTSVFVVLALTTAACSGDVVCAGAVLSRVLPADTSIAIHAAVVARFQQGATCNVEHPTDAVYSDVAATWGTTDTTIVQLDEATGRIVGRAPGDAHIRPVGREWLIVTVHVR